MWSCRGDLTLLLQVVIHLVHILHRFSCSTCLPLGGRIVGSGAYHILVWRSPAFRFWHKVTSVLAVIPKSVLKNCILEQIFMGLVSFRYANRTKKLKSPLFWIKHCEQVCLSKCCIGVYVFKYYHSIYIVPNAPRCFRFALQNYIFSFTWPNV